MRYSTTLLLLLVFCGACGTLPLSSVSSSQKMANLLANGGLEVWTFPNCPDRWICSQHAGQVSFRFVPDTTVRVEGQRSLSIERTGPEDWATLIQYLDPLSLRGNKLRLSASVKRQSVDGLGAGLVLFSDVPVIGRQSTVNTYATGSTEWQREEIIVLLPTDVGQLRVGAALEGSGKIWVDDVRAEIVAHP